MKKLLLKLRFFFQSRWQKARLGIGGRPDDRRGKVN